MQGGSQQRDNGELDIIWLSVGILLLAFAVFYLFHSEILTAILWIKYIELSIISSFVINNNYQSLANWVHHTDSAKIQYAELRLLSSELGQTLKYPCIFFSLVLAVLVYLKHPDSGYRDLESMKTLSAKVKKTFPAINILSGLKLVETPINQGAWAMADTPIEFAKRSLLISREANQTEIILDENKTKLIFNKQLGKRWTGIDALLPHEKALFAMFAAFANFKREEAEKKMENIAASLIPSQLISGKISFNTDAMLKKYSDTPVVQKILKKHAYTNTIFMEMLTEARKSGIVLNSLFLWLKPIDRPLWYTLNNVGRKAVFVEAAAVQAHWLAERRLGFAITQPMIDEAVAALDEALKSRIIKDI